MHASDTVVGYVIMTTGGTQYVQITFYYKKNRNFENLYLCGGGGGDVESHP